MSGLPSQGSVGLDVDVASARDVAVLVVVVINVIAGASPALVFLFMSDVHVNWVRNSGTRPVISMGSSAIEGGASAFSMNVKRWSSKSNRFGQFVWQKPSILYDRSRDTLFWVLVSSPACLKHAMQVKQFIGLISGVLSMIRLSTRQLG